MKKIIVALVTTFVLTSCSTDSNTAEIEAITTISESEIITEHIQEIDSTFEKSTMFFSSTNCSEHELIKFEYVPETANNSYQYYSDVDNETVAIIERATDIYYRYFLNLNESTFDNFGTVTVSVTDEDWGISYEEEYIRTGISFDSFCDFLCLTFTEEYANELMLNSKLYQNYNNELCFVPYAAYIPNDCFNKIEFTISDITDKRLTLCAVAEYIDIDDTNIVWESTYNFDILNTENGWRFDNFEVWK